jgi:hypothetical protein
MMNQQTVIYIILSAILLYLYYLKRELSIFMAFAVVVIGTLILEKESDEEGFGLGGGGGVDKKCAKIGFKEVKIDKDDINGSLKKVFDNFKSVTSKYVTYEEREVVPKNEYKSAIETIGKFEIIKSEMENLNKDKENQDYLMSIMFGSMSMLHSYLMQTAEEPRTSFIKMLDKLKTKDEKGRVGFELISKGGELGLKVINNIQKSDEMKAASDEVKNAFSVMSCSFKQVLTIWKKLEKSSGGGGGDDDGEKKKSSDDE